MLIRHVVSAFITLQCATAALVTDANRQADGVCEFPPALEEDLTHLRRKRLTTVEGIVCIEDYPYMASLRVNSEHRCGGAIVSRLWVLSAAQCFDFVMASEVSVRIGSVFRDYGGRILSAIRIIVHPKYRMDQRYPKHNLALVKVNMAITKSLRTIPVTVPTSDTPEPTEADEIYVTGYGSVKSTHMHPHVDQELRRMRVHPLEKAECRQLFGSQYRLQFDQVCLKSAPKISLCDGDTGDPAVIFSGPKRQGVLYGVSVYFGDGLCFNQTHAVYSKVKESLDWINQVLTDNVSESYNSDEAAIRTTDPDDYI